VQSKIWGNNCVIRHCFSIWALAIFALPSFAGVTVTSPASGTTLGSPVNYVATATAATCSKGVASMGVWVNNKLVYTSLGNSLSTSLPLSAGSYNSVVQEWDYCGGASFTPLQFTVSSTSAVVGTTISNLHAKGGWVAYGEYPPVYAICSGPCPGITWSKTAHIQSPSKSGDATKFFLGGTHPYADVLWTDGLIGQKSSLGISDSNHTLLPKLHHFTYDTYFYGANLELSQVLEFDINQYMNGKGWVWGTQCRIAGGHMWDIWDNVNSHWVSTGIPCHPTSGAWNHLVVHVSRNASNNLLYESITLNGVTHTLNKVYPPGTVGKTWWGLGVNFQMDGNSQQTDYSVFLDNLNFNYW
jgi:hypothetical protein